MFRGRKYRDIHIPVPVLQDLLPQEAIHPTIHLQGDHLEEATPVRVEDFKQLSLRCQVPLTSIGHIKGAVNNVKSMVWR